MAKNTPTTSATNTQLQAEKIANGTRTKGQTKAQTKLITQGIEKGIAEYKKQQKAKARTIDKDKKKQAKAKAQETQNTESIAELNTNKTTNYAVIVPWVLLALTWAGIGYYFLS